MTTVPTLSINGKDVSVPNPVQKLCDDCHDLGYDNCICDCGENLVADHEHIDHQCSRCGYLEHKI